MNICYLSKTFNQANGGIENYTYRMAKILVQKGHKVHILTSTGCEKYRLNPEASIFIHRIMNNDPFKGSWIINKIFPFYNILYSRRVSNRLYELIEKYKIDILESPDWLYEGLWFSFKKKIPIVVRLHGHNSIFKHYDLQNLPFYLTQRIQMLFEKRLVINADTISSVSNYYSTLISKIWKLKKKISVVYNAIDERMFLPSYGNETDEKYVLFVGRIGRAKGVDILIKAAPYLWENFPDLKFIFIGGDDATLTNGINFREYLLNSVNDKRIIILNSLPQEDLVHFYRNSTICVFPSLFENLCTAAIEAMACGKPIIASNIGGFQEIIDDGVNGILIPPNDVNALVDAMRKLLKEEDLRNYLGRNARKKVEDKFSIDKIADATISIYKEAIKKYSGIIKF